MAHKSRPLFFECRVMKEDELPIYGSLFGPKSFRTKKFFDQKVFSQKQWPPKSRCALAESWSTLVRLLQWHLGIKSNNLKGNLRKSESAVACEIWFWNSGRMRPMTSDCSLDLCATQCDTLNVHWKRTSLLRIPKCITHCIRRTV